MESAKRTAAIETLVLTQAAERSNSRLMGQGVGMGVGGGDGFGGNPGVNGVQGGEVKTSVGYLEIMLDNIVALVAPDLWTSENTSDAGEDTVQHSRPVSPVLEKVGGLDLRMKAVTEVDLENSGSHSMYAEFDSPGSHPHLSLNIPKMKKKNSSVRNPVSTSPAPSPSSPSPQSTCDTPAPLTASSGISLLPVYMKGGVMCNGLGSLLGNALALLFVARHGLKESELWDMLASLRARPPKYVLELQRKHAQQESSRQVVIHCI